MVTVGESSCSTIWNSRSLILQNVSLSQYLSEQEGTLWLFGSKCSSFGDRVLCVHAVTCIQVKCGEGGNRTCGWFYQEICLLLPLWRLQLHCTSCRKGGSLCNCVIGSEHVRRVCVHSAPVLFSLPLFTHILPPKIQGVYISFIC